MKNLTYILLLCALSFASCNDFLNVKPKTQAAQDEMFTSEQGFKDALTGVYMYMKDERGYGNAMTYGNIEHLVSSWNIAGDPGLSLSKFNYTQESAEGVLQSMFEHEYRIIVNINSILSMIDERQGVFTTPGMYEMIKGEALALRAYCHLDVLRLFGPIPSAPNNGNRLPYVTALSISPNDHLSFDAFREKLLGDLTAADNLLREVDPIRRYSTAELTVLTNKDSYFYLRKARMNYYAVKALEARAHLWFGENEKAYQCAKEVLGAIDTGTTKRFRLGLGTDMTTAGKDYALECEQIFGLHVYNLAVFYSDKFAKGAYYKGVNNTTVNSQLYGSTYASDVRAQNLWEVVSQQDNTSVKWYVIKKYKAELNTTGGMIPMLRTSEMYLIAIETTSDPTEAQQLWDAFRNARGLASTVLPTDHTQMQSAVMKEFRKEFFAEGQAFFAYKRLNAPASDIVFATTGITANYLPPLPKSESLTQ